MKTKQRAIRAYVNCNSSIGKEILLLLERDEITCPYCYSYTHYTYGVDCKCESCRQILNDGDIVYENQ